MSVTGDPDGEPHKVGVAWIDVLTGMTAAIGILAALNERQASGERQYIDLGLFDVGVMAMANLAQSYLMTGIAPGRLGNAHPQIVPYQTFRASDGWLMLAVGNDEQFRRMTNAVGCPELWDDERFRPNTGRVEAREDLVKRLEEILARKPRDAWLQRFTSAGVPASAVMDMQSAFNDEQATARGLRWPLRHPKLGDIDMVANALQHMSRTPARPGNAPPMLGEHTRSSLKHWLSLDQSTLDQLVIDGVVVDGLRS